MDPAIESNVFILWGLIILFCVQICFFSLFRFEKVARFVGVTLIC